MNHKEYYSNTDNLTLPNDLPDELASISQDLESLSGDALDICLKRWKTLLLTDTAEPSLILTIFLKVCRKVINTAPPRDCLLFLNFLSQLKQSLFSYNIFCYGEHIYNAYLENIYYLSGCCSYYFKDAFLQKYAAGESEHYRQIRATLEEHYQNEMSKWLERDLKRTHGDIPHL